MRTLAGVPGVRLAAVCDVWDANLQKAREIADPKAFVTKIYSAVLERKDIDAVLIGTPDHWHVPMTVDACAAGKDVYVEKPLTHDLSEGTAVIEAQNRYRRIVQVGTQQRSMPHFQKAYQIVKSGQLGSIHKVHLTWNRNRGRSQPSNLGINPKTVDWKQFLGRAKDQPFDEYRFRYWRFFWDFGGGILTDLMVHFEGIFNARNGATLEFMGTDATLYLDRGRYEIHPEPDRKLEYGEMVLGEGPRGRDSYKNPDSELLHLTNWIDCIRSRQKPNAPAEAGVSAAEGAHLANRAYRTGQVAKWPTTAEVRL